MRLPSVDHLPDYGIETLLTCLHEDYRRTGELWFAEAAEAVYEQWRSRLPVSQQSDEQAQG